MSANIRRAASGGIAGPFVFVATWFVAGLVKPRYSMLHDPISELAAIHASTRPYMTAAFIVFAVGMFCYARALRAAPFGAAWVVAAISGLATAGVAAFPLHHSGTVDRLHGVFAGTGYVTLAATALWCGISLARAGSWQWAALALPAGVVCAVALALTLVGSFEGLLQRVGLTAGDVWVVCSALAVRRGVWSRPGI